MHLKYIVLQEPEVLYGPINLISMRANFQLISPNRASLFIKIEIGKD
jgi:hypothetical protein